MMKEYFVQDAADSNLFAWLDGLDGVLMYVETSNIKALVEDANYADQQPPTVITASGYDALIDEDGTVRPYTDELDYYDDEQVALASQVEANTRAFSYEVTDRNQLRSKRAHTVLGTLSLEGEFVPIVTILHSTHPAVAKTPSP